jgi:hypothetical protein
MNAFHKAIAAANTVVDLEELAQGAIGSSDLMEFVRFDVGEVLRKERSGQGPKILRSVFAEPVMKRGRIGQHSTDPEWKKVKADSETNGPSGVTSWIQPAFQLLSRARSAKQISHAREHS